MCLLTPLNQTHCLKVQASLWVPGNACSEERNIRGKPARAALGRAGRGVRAAWRGSPHPREEGGDERMGDLSRNTGGFGDILGHTLAPVRNVVEAQIFFFSWRYFFKNL